MISDIFNPQYILPLLTAIPAGVILILHIRKGNLLNAVLDMILYVFWLTVIGLPVMYFFPDSDAILHGHGYWEEMLPWLHGMENSIEGTASLFIPVHLLEVVIVAVSSLISAGMIALVFGTALVNYMNFYVSQLMYHSPTPLLMAVIGWHPWSICRVISFIILGSVCAIPMIYAFRRDIKVSKKTILLMITLSILLEVADILLKTYIGDSWRDLLVRNISLPDWHGIIM